MLSRLFFEEQKAPQKRKLEAPQKKAQQKAPQKKESPKTKMEAEQEEDSAGSVHESDVAHWRRHSAEPSSKKCCRCNYIRNKAELHREHPWLKPRPSCMGGRWRLGCDCCKWMSSNSQQETHVGRRGSKVRSCTFANFKFVYNGNYERRNEIL